MRTGRWMMGSLLTIAVIVGGMSPAQARPRHGGYYGGYHGGGGHWHRRDRGDGFGVGDAIGVAALVGAVAIVANSMSKDRKAAQGRDTDHRGYDDDYDRDAQPAVDEGGDDDSAAASFDSADSATDACAVAARDEASAQGGYAEIRHMESPQSVDGGYNIDGEVENRASWSAAGGSTRRFTCSIREGRVAEVYLSRDTV